MPAQSVENAFLNCKTWKKNVGSRTLFQINVKISVLNLTTNQAYIASTCIRFRRDILHAASISIIIHVTRTTSCVAETARTAGEV